MAALQNKLKIYVEQDIFMHVLAGALQMKRIGNRLEIWIEYVCFSLNCIALVGTIHIYYLNGYFGHGRHLGEHSTFSYQSRPILKLNVFRCFTNGRFNISDLILSNYFFICMLKCLKVSTKSNRLSKKSWLHSAFCCSAGELFLLMEWWDCWRLTF